MVVYVEIHFLMPQTSNAMTETPLLETAVATRVVILRLLRVR